MYFEGRELTNSAIPVKAEELVLGEFYYHVTFFGSGLLIPNMDTLVYVGKDVIPHEPGLFYFQDAESYANGLRIDSEDNKEGIILSRFDENSLNGIFDFDRALESLMRCSLLRQKQKKKDG